MRIVLTRHATTDWNVASRIQGLTDIPLNATGRTEATAIAPAVAAHRVTRIVSSDLARARETGAIIAAAIGVPHAIHPGLRECGFGSLEGLTPAQVAERYPTVTTFRQALDSPRSELRAYDFRSWGGEDAAAVLSRHLALFDALRRDHATGTICCVGHGRGLGTVLACHWNSPPIPRGVVLALEYPHRSPPST